MKKSLLWMLLLIVCAVLQQCKKDSEPVSRRKVQFSFTVADNPKSGGRTQSVDPTTLLLSLTNSSGEPVFTSKHIALLKVGGQFMTEPIDLITGTYSITDFLLTDAGGNVLLATPKFGSPLANVVQHPLPFTFTVDQDAVSNIDMEVVDVSQSTPEDFGYASFAINEIPVNHLSIAVFIPTSSGLVLTTANADLVYNDGIPLGTFELEAKTNVITFKAGETDSYFMTVTKAGYGQYQSRFDYSELVASLNGEPLKIILYGFSMTAHIEGSTGGTFQIGLGGNSGNINIDWGDGSSDDNIALSGDGSGVPLHAYDAPGDYHVVVSGEISEITEFLAEYEQAAIDAIELGGLTKLRDFRLGLTHGPAAIDLSKNLALTNVLLESVHQMERVILPDAQLSGIDITGPNLLSTEAVDAAIQRVHENAVKYSLHNGYFQLKRDFMSNDGLMVGPPSPDAIDMLQDLRNNFNWSITPDPGS